MQIKTFIIAIFLTLNSFLLSSCENNTSQPVTVTISEIQGNRAERITKIMQVVDKSGKLKQTVKDAYLIEKQLGDGYFGSSDYVCFITLEIEKSAIPTWRKLSPQLKENNNYAAPPKPVSWWVSEQEFKKLELFNSIISPNGWMGVSPQGKVYIYRYTT